MHITELEIKTKDLSSQQVFYENTLGLKATEKKKDKVSYNIGSTKLTIAYSNNFKPYHFAINIPCNQTNEALKWLKDRINTLKCGEDDIQDFNTWNAKAMYFYDADQNILEFIARKNLKNESTQAFSTKSLLQISEIGVPVSTIEDVFNQLNEIFQINLYDGNLERFCAIGDENGMFICLNKDVKKWFPTGDKAHSSNFKIKFKNKGNHYQLSFTDGRIKATNDQNQF